MLHNGCSNFFLTFSFLRADPQYLEAFPGYPLARFLLILWVGAARFVGDSELVG
jgi:hypothetical protein